MMRPLFSLRVGSLLASASWALLSVDPRGFAAKLAERIRLSSGGVSRPPISWLNRLAASSPSRAREMIDAGELTAGLRAVVEQGHGAPSGDLHLARRTAERLEQLRSRPATGRTPRTSGGELRVLHFLTNSYPHTQSGYTVRSHHVLECQRAAGIVACAVTRLGYPVLVGRIPSSDVQEIDQIHYRRLLPWRYPAGLAQRHRLALRLLVARARDMEATVLHTTTDYLNALVVAEASQELGVPWIYEVRGELESTWASRQPDETTARESEFYRLAREQETRCMQAADAVVALSEISRGQLIDRGIPSEKITVIPNAIDERELGRDYDRAEIRRELGLDPDATLVGTVTAVVGYEGLDTLLTAVEHLPADHVVLIVGDGTARPELERLAEQMGVAHRVIFVGRQPAAEIWRWYAALDVFVVPRSDTHVTRTVTPIKPLQAMALNIPVVASDLPALREVTGNRAVYVSPGDPSALADAITRTLGTSQRGPEWVAGRTWTQNGQLYRRVYETVR